ncbi:hypothetical protein WG936_02080 [Corynebacterium sp. H127]
MSTDLTPVRSLICGFTGAFDWGTALLAVAGCPVCRQVNEDSRSRLLIDAPD